MQVRYEELKDLYLKNNGATLDKSQPNQSNQSADLPADMDAYLNKIRSLESKIELGKKII